MPVSEAVKTFEKEMRQLRDSTKDDVVHLLSNRFHEVLRTYREEIEEQDEKENRKH